MLDLLIGTRIFDFVIKNDRIKNKRWGFLWREFLVFFAVECLILVVGLTIQGWTAPWRLVALILVVLMIPCVLLPIFHFSGFNPKK